MSKCEDCLHCKVTKSNNKPTGAYCKKGHWSNDFMGDCGGLIPSIDDCQDNEIDHEFTWRAPLIVHYRRTKDGGIEVSHLTDCNGLLPDVDITKAVIHVCEEGLRSHPQPWREKMRNEFWASFDNQNHRQPKEKSGPRKGLVYVMFDVIRQYYKIGFTKSIDTRFATLKTANPAIEIRAHYNGSENDERKLHNLFDKLGKRVDREWFSLTDADLGVINEYFTCQTEMPC